MKWTWLNTIDGMNMIKYNRDEMNMIKYNRWNEHD